MNRLCNCLLLFCLMVICFGLSAVNANAASVDDLNYKIENGEVTITSCNHDATGELVIPSTIEGYPVTTIGKSAFIGCRELTQISIPESITNIEYMALTVSFYFLGEQIPGKLQAINVHKDNPVFSSDSRGVLYTKDMTEIIQVPSALQGSYNIPSGTTKIGSYSFYCCASLTDIQIPDSVYFVGVVAFGYCKSLTAITIPDSVRYVYTSAFKRSGLESVSIGKGLSAIDDEVFADCINLSNISIPAGVTSIGNSAFSYCISLSSVHIPGNVSKIGDNAFEDCYDLTSVFISEGVTSIGVEAFTNCEKLTNISIPSTVNNIGFSAFSSCQKLETITIDLNNAWFCCHDGALFTKDKQTILWLSNVKSGSYIIPDFVTTIGDGAFKGCYRISSISIPTSVTKIGNDSFQCGISEIVIPNSVTSIGAYAFAYSPIEKITVPDSVTELGECAFLYCTKLKTVDIGNGISTIKYNTFQDCENLTFVKLGNNVAKIESNAFVFCYDFSIFIPKSVTSIETQYANFLVWHILYEGTEAQWNKISPNAFYFAPNDDFLYFKTHYNCDGDEITTVNSNSKQDFYCSICDRYQFTKPTTTPTTAKPTTKVPTTVTIPTTTVSSSIAQCPVKINPEKSTYMPGETIQFSLVGDAALYELWLILPDGTKENIYAEENTFSLTPTQNGLYRVLIQSSEQGATAHELSIVVESISSTTTSTIPSTKPTIPPATTTAVSTTTLPATTPTTATLPNNPANGSNIHTIAIIVIVCVFIICIGVVCYAIVNKKRQS